LSLFIYLKKETPTPLRAMVVVEGGEMTKHSAGVAFMFRTPGSKERRESLHTVKPSYPKSSFSVIAAAMPAGLPRRQNESNTIRVKVSGRPVKKTTSLKKRVFLLGCSIPLLGQWE
jgi:hypothetical protein